MSNFTDCTCFGTKLNVKISERIREYCMHKIRKKGKIKDSCSESDFYWCVTAFLPYRDSITIPIINCLTSFYAGFAIFSVLGYMARAKNVSVSAVTTEGCSHVSFFFLFFFPFFFFLTIFHFLSFFSFRFAFGFFLISLILLLLFSNQSRD